MFATPANLTRLEKSGLFSEADLYQARYTASLAAPEHRELVAGLTALVSLAVREGHVCLDLRDDAVLDRLRQFDLLMERNADLTETLIATAVIGRPGSGAPLISSGSRLYFSRFFHDEARVAATILQLCAAVPASAQQLTALGKEAFASDEGEPDWQRIAAFAALRSRFCVISGGPGTGKTRTVATILTLAAQLAGDEPFSIRLAAPTGKAAGHMTESVTSAFGAALPPALSRCLQAEALTVHRLLGWRPGGYTFDAGNPLPLDMLVVDEASMLDLNMFARLLDALPAHARLILLGDRNQLASVEAGAVLANLCRPDVINAFSAGFAADLQACGGPELQPAPSLHPLTDHVLELQKSYRFTSDSGIASLSLAIRDGHATQAAEILANDRPDLHILPCSTPRDLHTQLQRLVQPTFADLSRTADPVRAFAALNRLRLLSPLHHGPRGVETVNRTVQEILTGSSREVWYHGRPVMVLENDYGTGLFNGDVGIALPVDGTLRVFFQDGASCRSFAPARLPRTATCYCMTVHKSQGSEFDHAVLVLPGDAGPVPGRELVYTALTRARTHFTLLGSTERFLEAIGHPVRRDSGLGDALSQMRP